MKRPTQEQIDDWKKQHGDIFEVEVEGKSAIIRQPNRKDLDHAQVTSMKGGTLATIEYSETLLKDCWLDGDSEMLSDDKYFLPMVSKIEEIGKRAEATAKKL